MSADEQELAVIRFIHKAVPRASLVDLDIADVSARGLVVEDDTLALEHDVFSFSFWGWCVVLCAFIILKNEHIARWDNAQR